MHTFRLSLLLLLPLQAVHAQGPVVQWAKELGSDGARCVRQTADSGFILAGQIYLTAGSTDMHLIKTDRNGDTLWTRRHEGGIYGAYNDGYCVRQTSDGGFIAVGYIALDGYVVKTYADGSREWSRSYFAYMQGYENVSHAVVQTSSGDYIVAGTSRTYYDGTQISIMKLTAAGDSSWIMMYGGSKFEDGFDMQRAHGSGVVVVGAVHPTSTLEDRADLLIMKISESGVEEWKKVYAWPGVDVGRSICAVPDGGYLVAGYTNSFGSGGLDALAMKVTSTGDSVWTKTCGDWRTERAFAACVTPAGEYVLAGTQTATAPGGTSIYLVGISAQGDSLWSSQIWGTTGQQAAAYSVDTTRDGGYVIAGRVYQLYGNIDSYLVKLQPGTVGIKERSPLPLPERAALLQNYPNPFNPRTTIPYALRDRSSVELTVFNTLGQRVAVLVHGVQEAGFHTVQFDASGIASGVYFYRLHTRDIVQTRRLVITK